MPFREGLGDSLEAPPLRPSRLVVLGPMVVLPQPRTLLLHSQALGGQCSIPQGGAPFAAGPQLDEQLNMETAKLSSVDPALLLSEGNYLGLRRGLRQRGQQAWERSRGPPLLTGTRPWGAYLAGTPASWPEHSLCSCCPGSKPH